MVNDAVVYIYIGTNVWCYVTVVWVVVDSNFQVSTRVQKSTSTTSTRGQRPEAQCIITNLNT